MRIALIGPGIIPIPPDGWGAVESLIWDYAVALRQKGHEVDIYNDPDLTKVAQEMNDKSHDFIHCQYDDHAGVLSELLDKPFVATSHFGYLKEQRFWGGYASIHRGVMRANGIIALSPEIRQVYLDSGYNGFLAYLRNGTNVNKFNYKLESNNRAICLGKIEPRKLQTPIASLCNNACPIDFVGPIVDSSFAAGGICKYLGPWTKEQVYSNLTDYGALVLLSAGEAAPLVVPEALAAGLSVVVSRSAAANLDPMPFVYLYEPGMDLPKLINKAIAENSSHREQIRAYAAKRFDWSVIADEYLEIIKEFQNYNLNA